MNKQIFYDLKQKKYNAVMTPGSLYEKIYKKIGSDLKILDIGTANGNFAKELKEKNNTLFGIEISKIMAKQASGIYEKIIVGDVETISFPWKRNSFDSILVMDILEHLFLCHLR